MSPAPKQLTQVPLADPGASYKAHRSAVDRAISSALESGRYILGGESARFEESFAKYVGVSHCIGVANGTDAIVVALRAAGIKSGDEVVTVSHTAVATVAAIELTGAVPVFVDIEPETRCMNPELLAGAVSAQTKALVPVHIYGQPARIEEIVTFARERGIAVIEDCAQAHGAMVGDDRVGTFGDAAAFSFYPTKNLGTFGDGGAVVTDSGSLAEWARMLRQYGWRERYISEIPGLNSRLDELHAAVLSAKLPGLDANNERRRTIAARYREAITASSVRAPRAVPGTTPVWHLFVVECDDREGFRRHMDQAGIQTALHYPQAVHQQPAYYRRIRGWDSLPETERLYTQIVSLPLYPELDDDQVGRVCEALASYR